MRTSCSCQEHVGVQYRSKRGSHLKLPCDGLVLIPKDCKGRVPVFLPKLYSVGVCNSLGRYRPCLSPVTVGTERLQFRLVTEEHLNPGSQIGDRGNPGMHIGGNVEGHGHMGRLSSLGESASSADKLVSSLRDFLLRPRPGGVPCVDGLGECQRWSSSG